MAQKTITINGQKIEPGENKTVILNSYELHTKTKIENLVLLFCYAPVCMAKKQMVLR